MFGNLWLSSALAVVAIFSASVAYKSYQDIKEVKEMKESYEILSDIKTLLATQYNKSPNEITRDEIIAFLPEGGSWEKLLLLNRNSRASISSNSLVSQDGNYLISEDEKLKLLALKSKLEKYGNSSGITKDSTNYKVVIGDKEKNIIQKDLSIQKALDKAIDCSSVIVFTTGITSGGVRWELDKCIDTHIPLDDIYHNLKEFEDEVISDTELINRKKQYFEKRMREKLLENNNAYDNRLYFLIKDI